MEEFHEVLEDCRLMDVGYSGSWFTWERENLSKKKKTLERLNRGVERVDWMTMFSNVVI